MGGLSLRKNANSIKNHFTAAIGEVLGTTMFLFLAEGAAKTANLSKPVTSGAAANAPLDTQTIMMISTAFGLSLLVAAWIFYRITGGLFNPAITVALWLIGVLTTTRAIFIFIAQICGGLIAAALVNELIPSGTKGVNAVATTLSAQTTNAQGVLLEFLGTSALVFSVLMLAVEKHRATYLAPVGIGLTLFSIQMVLTAWTGCSVNPARSLGPAVVAKSFPSYFWIYWVGPICGGIFSIVYYTLLKALKYNAVVLDQDSDHETKQLRPVYVRWYKFLRGHHDWEHATEPPTSPTSSKPPHDADITSGAVDGNGRPNDNVSGLNSSGLPMPVSMQAYD